MDLPVMSTPMPAPQPPVGFGVSAGGVKDAIGAGAPIVQADQALKQMGEQEQSKQQAIAYQKLLRSGSDGMNQYADEVAKEYPQLGEQLKQEAGQYSGFLNDPNLTGDKAEEYAHHFYESANNRVKAIKDAKAAAAPRPWAPTSYDEAVQFDLDKKQNSADTRPPPKSGPGSPATNEKKMKALRELPGVWSQIDDMIRGNVALPITDSPAKMDPLAFANAQPKEWRSTFLTRISKSKNQGGKYVALRKQLADLESKAGLEASSDILGPGRDNSMSFKLTKGLPNIGGNPSGASAPAAPQQAQSSTDAALSWLKKPENKSNPYRDSIIQELKKSGVDTRGL